MERKLATALGLAWALSASAVNARDFVLEPTSDWVLDYATEGCTLVRQFGNGKDEVRLRIDSFGSWSNFRFLAVGRLIPIMRRPAGTTWIRFTPDSQDREVRSLHGDSDRQPAVGFMQTIDSLTEPAQQPEEVANVAAYLARPSLARFERETRTLTLRFPNRTRIELRLGSLAGPLAALRTCVDDLHRSWGLDPVLMKTLARPAVPKPETVGEVQRNYPFSMSVRGTSAFVPVRVMVDPSGRAIACVVQNEAANDDFKRAVCDSLDGGFDPALDADGRPVMSVHQTSVIYLIGG